MRARAVGIVALTYPPYEHVSVLRASRFAEELRDRGWKVTVITASPPDAPPTIAEETGIDVWRFPSRSMAPTWEPSSGRTRGKLGLAFDLLRDGAFSDWVQGMHRFVVEQRLSIPPVLWAINGGDSAHALADRCGARWIADFKDAWDFGRLGLARGLERVATARRLRASAGVTAASYVGAKDIQDEFGHCPEVIYTGVDLDVYASEPPRYLGEGLEVVYSGNVDRHMRLDTFAQGMAIAVRSMPQVSMRLHHFGYDQGGIRSTFQCHEIEANLVSHGYVERSAAVGYQKGASLLLHLARVPAKQFSVKYLEYLAAGRPVLSVPRDPESDQDSRLRVLSAGDPTEVSDHLLRLAAAEPKSLTPPDLSSFSWRAQTDRLETVLERVLQGV